VRVTNRLRNLRAGLIVTGHASTMLLYAGVALFLPLIREDLDLTFSQAGSLAVAITATYAAMQIPAGFLTDRFGARRLFIGGLVGTHLLALGLAASTAYWQVLVVQAAIGLTRSLVFTPGLVLVAAQFDARKRATAMSLYSAGAFALNVLLNAIGPLLVVFVGWRTMFVLFAAIGFLLVVGFRKVSDPETMPTGQITPPRIGELVGLLRHPILWLTGFVQFVRLAVAHGMLFWLPSILVEDKGLLLSTTGLVIAVGTAAAVPAIFLGGYLSDRFDRPLVVIGTSLAVLGVMTTLLAGVQTLPVILVTVVVLSVFVQVYFGPLFALPPRYLGLSAAGTTSGFSNLCANLGGLASTYTLGVIRDTTGSFAPGLYTLSGLCALALAVTVSLRWVGKEPEAAVGSPGP
jgi:nitrate/nitrite transporter NarK